VLRDLAKRNLPKSGAELLDTEVLLLDMGVRDYCSELGDAGAPSGALGDGGKKLRL
jgi:hypothetical protein